MRRLGLPVPSAFVVTTEACRAYLKTGELLGRVADEVEEGLLGST
jgi:pyruvate,orthophosphate dikinase